MYPSDLDTLRFMAGERNERFMHEAQAERLAKEARGAPQTSPRWRLHLPFAAGRAWRQHHRTV